MRRTVVRRLAGNVVLGGPFIAVTYAALLAWVERSPFADELLHGAVFAAVWLTGRGVAGLWTLRRDPDRFLRRGALPWLGLERVDGRER